MSRVLLDTDTGSATHTHLKAHITDLNAYEVGGTDVPVTDGGTGASTAAGARTNLDVDQSGTDNAPAASTTTAGKIEIATQAEVDAGTDTSRALTPDTFVGSDLSIKYAQVRVFEAATDVATGDDKATIHIPPGLDGMNLVYVHAEVDTAGTTGTTDIQIHNIDNALDMLSTKLTIDSTETGSDTAAIAAVINASNDHVNTNDVVRIDVDAVSTTAPTGLLVTLGFQLP